MTGFTAFTGADVTIGESWTVDCADLMKSGASFTSDGRIAFAEGAALRLVIPDGAKTEWKISKSADGKSIVLARTPLGIMLIVR